jgi:hypothetical protein
MYERPPYPDYWLMPSSERALSTNVGTHRINWDLRYDDPPGYNPDINNQMNSAPGQVTPAPHGPLALPGTYTVKLLVDGATYTQTLVVHNDPRVGESAPVMSALRTQNKLALAAWQRHEGQLRRQRGSGRGACTAWPRSRRGSLPPDVATAATALDAKLATFGGAWCPRRTRRWWGRRMWWWARTRCRQRDSRSIDQRDFQHGPRAALRRTASTCRPPRRRSTPGNPAARSSPRRLNAWKTMLDVDLVGFNSLLTKNNLTPLKVAPTALASAGVVHVRVVHRDGPWGK